MSLFDDVMAELASLDEPKMNLGLLACVWLVAVLTAFAADRALVERERRAHAAS